MGGVGSSAPLAIYELTNSSVQEPILILTVVVKVKQGHVLAGAAPLWHWVTYNAIYQHKQLVKSPMFKLSAEHTVMNISLYWQT